MRRSLLALVSIALLAAAVFLWSRGGDEPNARERGASAAPESSASQGGEDPANADLRATDPFTADPGAAQERDREAALPREAASPGELGLAFVDPDGAAIEGATWLAFRGGALLARGTSDAAGHAEISHDALGAAANVNGEPAAELAARASGFAPVRRALDALEPGVDGRRVVTLGAGAEISGTMRVDGGEPSERVLLSLGGEIALIDAEGLPPEARGPILRGRPVADGLTVRVEPDGSFRFRGLPEGWSGDLSWGSSHAFASAEPASLARPVAGGVALDASAAAPAGGEPIRAVRVAAPLVGLELELTTLPYLFGRIADPETGEAPDERASVRVRVGGSSRGTSAQDDGSFRFTYPRGLPSRVDVDVSAGASSAVARTSIEIPPGARRYDCGVLFLPTSIEVSYRVVDEAGEPIADARVEPVPGSDAIFQEVAPEGVGVLNVPLRTRAIRAIAVGYAATEAPLPPAGETLVIELVRGATLVVTLPEGSFGRSGDDATGARVFVTADEPPFEDAGGPTWTPEVGELGTERTTTGSSLELAGATDGRYELGGVRAGVAFTVAARDELGGLYDEREVAPLAPGETREIALDFELERHVVRGRVVGPDGEAVVGARVAVGGDLSIAAAFETWWIPTMDAVTGADGAFEIADVPLARGDVTVSAEGYAPARTAGVAFDGPPLTLVLERGREVRLAIVDADGAPVPGTFLTNVAGASGWILGATKDGEVHVLPNAPAGAFDVLVRACGRPEVVAIPAGVDDVRHDLGRVIRCIVELPGRNDAWPDTDISVVLRRDDVEPAIWQHARAAAGAEHVTFDAVLPGVYQISAERLGPRAEIVSDPLTASLTDDEQHVVLTLRPR